MELVPGRAAVPADNVKDDVRLAATVVYLDFAVSAHLHDHQVRDGLAGAKVEIRCRRRKHHVGRIDSKITARRRLRHSCVQDHRGHVWGGWDTAHPFHANGDGPPLPYLARQPADGVPSVQNASWSHSIEARASS